MRKRPNEGTFIRAVYDVLFHNRGKPVNIYEEVEKIFDTSKGMDRSRWSNAIVVLNRDYDCDIEMVQIKHYVMKGQFVGRDWETYA
jgi:hypothetical protein